MTTYGIRISDGENGILKPTLLDILGRLKNGNSFHWSIYFLDRQSDTEFGDALMKYQSKVNTSASGAKTSFEELKTLSKQYHQIYETLILGNMNRLLSSRLDSSKKMYESNDITIELIDCAFWEIFTKDRSFINKLSDDFKNVEYLETNLNKECLATYRD